MTTGICIGVVIGLALRTMIALAWGHAVQRWGFRWAGMVSEDEK